MKKDILVLMSAIIISKTAAFAKDIVLSYYYGASEISDAYLISLTIPIIIFGIIGTSIATGYTPIYNEIVKEHGLGRGVKFTNHITNLTLISCTIFVLLVLIFPETVVRMFASGFSSTAMETAVTFTRISIIGIFFIGTFYVFEAFLQQNNSYSVSAFMALPVNLLVIAIIAASTKTDKLVLSIGTVFTIVLHTLSLLFFSFRKGYRYQFELDFNDTYLKKMILLALPLIIGSSTYQINQIIQRTIASQISVGGITTLSYAQKLASFMEDIFILSIVTVLFPNLSKMAARSHMDRFKNTVCDAVDSICLLVIPSTIGAMVFSKPIIELLFHRGAFDAQAVAMTSDALFFYSLGMTAFGIRSVFVKAFYSLKDAKTPVINSVISIISNILLNILFARYLGIGGLALASSFSGTLGMILLYFSLRKKIGPMKIKNFAVTSLKILLISSGMGSAAKLSFEVLKTTFSQNVSLILSICIGAIFYVTVISYAKINMVDTMKIVFTAKIKSLFRRKDASEETLPIRTDLSNPIYINIFSKYETGLPPSDWSVRWSMDAEFAVLESEDIAGRKFLRADTCSCVFDNKLISWNPLNSSFNIHVCVKIRTRETGGYRAWLAVRCSGASYDPSGYLLVMGADEVQIISYLNGNYQFHKGYPFAWNANTWYWLDFRAEGNLLQGKVWEDGATEPGDYQISITDSRVTSGGWVGFGGLSPGYYDCGVFTAELL